MKSSRNNRTKLSCAPLDDELLDDELLDEELDELLDELELDELELLLDELELLDDEEFTLLPPQPINKAVTSVAASGIAIIPITDRVFIWHLLWLL